MLRDHPRGLLVLFFTEMWERFGFYVLMAILYLYMSDQFGWNEGQKGNCYGAFLGVVYFIPILGGFLGDRVLGQRNTIRLGAVLMVIGYVALAASSSQRVSFFFIGLGLVAAGTGLFKANISVVVGNLYQEGSRLKDAAFNIFYMGVNIGATLSPLAATYIGKHYDGWVKWLQTKESLASLATSLTDSGFGKYNLSFAAAGVGMVLSMIIFQAGRRHLTPVHEGGSAGTSSTEDKDRRPFSREDWQRVQSLAILFIIVIFFWIPFYQNGSSMTAFAERSTAELDYLKPETYQFFNPFFILLLTPLLLALFGKLRDRGKEPSSASKICSGLFLLSLSVFVMVLASLAGGNQDKKIMSPMWLISSYFLVTIAEILVSPMGLSFVSKVAPKRIRGLMMGFWFSATAVGSYIAGRMAGLYDTMPHHLLFLIIAALPLLACVLALPFLGKLNKFSK
jgi:proton-dependent oligopeptide transporter, POT family